MVFQNFLFFFLAVNAIAVFAEECEDRTDQKSCNYYKGLGYCNANSAHYDWAKYYCRKTCGFCVTPTQAPDHNDVIELTDSNFEKEVLQTEEMVLVDFFAPWCSHCIKLAPEWAKAATELKGKVKVGHLDCTVHKKMKQRWGITGFPTIKMWPAGKREGKSFEYNGQRTASAIVAWALDKLPPKPTSAPKPTSDPTKCEDNIDCCASLVAKGFCSEYEKFMGDQCQKSCDKCVTPTDSPTPDPSGCEDKSENCKVWAAEGECQVNQEVMAAVCKKSCGLC